MVEHEIEPAAITIEHRVETAFDDEIQSAMFPIVVADQKAGTQHRGQRQRDDDRDQNTGHDGNGEFVKQPADDATHQQ